ncbi:LmbE family N-acetylglucosaminyl deacetylase [Algoriphagus boseongensis]|uniref:LmbE family N-acetylglucosaminyl deacetylase n=1 Tax=Algoriphagus boseongensis TaxID=1442587 RepID=A0A4R6TCN8_9BACT|nr:PIG-L family deacetylase [Algoriphagus boseongensis]TDQ19214.1 LmbE family N-acetylglucosaminyl deacetylase [Algoriphagus boseongensis]
MKKWLIVSLGIIGFILLLSPWILILFAKGQLHDAGIPQRNNLIEDEPKQRVLALFPHPDDEVTVAGTLMKLKDQGHEIYLVCLTRGEKGKSAGIEDEVELARLRTEEMKNSAAEIGVDQLLLKDYPDGGLTAIGLDSLKEIAKEIILEIQPDLLISYDSKVGLYGHPDHRLSGLAVEEVFKENLTSPDFSPKRLFQVTLCSNQIDVALKLSSGFQKNYPDDLSQGLPYPDFSVNTQPYFRSLLKVMAAHETQQAVLKDLMPYHKEVPIWIYSRIFDREYFHEVK